MKKTKINSVKSTQRYVVLDVETTGLYAWRGDRIIEIGAIEIMNGLIVEEFHSFIAIGKPISKAAQKIHGITAEMLIGQSDAKEVLTSFRRFIGTSILVAHNADFDIKFLRYELSRLGLGMSNGYLCTMRMSKKKFPELPNHKLETVSQHVLGKLPEGLRLHRALDDARMVAMIWLAMGGR
jgi:DNA polymerase III epsilon subunit